jgi:hypothetical protein
LSSLHARNLEILRGPAGTRQETKQEKNMRKTMLFALAFVLMTPIVFGQAFTTLTGVVTDPTGGIVPAATITVVNAQTGAKRETVSNDAGAYTFSQILPGTWHLTAMKPGFNSVEIQDIQLRVNTPGTVNIRFDKVGGIEATVVVTASAAILNTTDATLGNALTGSSILQLPAYARNITTLLLLQPGVTDGGQVNGGKSDQANVTLDGVDINNQVNRSVTDPVLRVTLDSVQEFRTTTTNANADQGRGSGAEVALVTKSGTNDYHGSLYEYNRNELFASNGFFNNRSGLERPALKINVFGASFGGPIFRNKLFIFANYEGRRDASASTASRTVPSDDLRNGIVTYHNAAGVLSKIGPDDIKRYADPLGIGPNPNVLKIFNAYPRCNVPDSGDLLNNCTYRFNFPRHSKQDTYIAKLDYTVDPAGKHTVFARGNLQNDHSPGTPQFPGYEGTVSLNNNKGMAAGHTWVIRPNIVNSFKYGFTRQGGESTGLQTAPVTTFRGFTSLYATGTATQRFVPVHNLTEDFSWNRGDHDLRFGATLRFVSNRSMRNDTYHGATTNGAGLAGGGNDLYANIPGGLLPGDATSYRDAMTALLGLISQVNARYKYVAKPDGSATVVPQGGFVKFAFAGHEYELYAQDSWRLRNNLTVTAGIRYSLMPPVHETNGQQVSPSIPLAEWLARRRALADQGLSQAGAGDISFILSSMSGGREMYPFNKNWAPRLGLAYSPGGDGKLSRLLFGGPGKSSIRAGIGMYYDLIGQPLANLFSNTAFGLSTSLSNPLNVLGASTVPRFVDFYQIPTDLLPAAPPAGFPVTYPLNSFAITNSLDDQLLAPYTTNMNLSWSREFGKGISVQLAYVGRLSRHSLIQRDLAMPTNLKDPSSGLTYFQAMSALAAHTDMYTPVASRGDSWKTIAPIAFFENMWPDAAGRGYTATQNIANYYVKSTAKGDFTTALQAMDFTCVTTGNSYRSNGNVLRLNCSKLGRTALFSNQFGALAGWSSISSGNYHGGQLTVRKRFSDSMQIDFNYTLSKSIDLGSGNESSGSFGGGFVTNTWDPGQQRAVSDYDFLHQINAYGTYAIPVGRGKMFGSQMRGILDAILGGWQVSGIFRYNSADTISTSTGSVWPTNWQLSNPAVPTGLPFPEFNINPNGTLPGGTVNVTAFATKADGEAAVAAYRQSFPGEYGLRNNIRTWGSWNIDSVLAKSFKMPYSEGHALQIRWETFNMTNSVIFGNPGFSMTSTSTAGRITSQRNNPRVMQFGIRYDF